jgi:heme/copper-type cytochrome/quinol oxidase subunit 3
VPVTHLLLVLAAHVLFVVMGFRALTGQVSARRRELVAAAAAFWHFTVIAGAAVYLVVFFFEGAPA